MAPPTTMFSVRSIRMRMWWTTLLVLIALGGAGLAVAADRPHNPVQRPELTWRADHSAQPWITAIADDLEMIDQDVVNISDDGRDVLGSLQSLDLESMNGALTDGNQVADGMDGSITSLLALRDQALGEIEDWRLGPATRDLLNKLNAASESAQQVPGLWRGLAASASRVAGLVDALLRHDGLVFRATTAGRQARWDEALQFLAQAAGPLGDATATRDRLAADGNVDTLDDMLDRYSSYDGALTALYAYIRATGNQEGVDFEALRQDVEVAQAALPADTSAMSVIVGEAAGPPVTNALVAIEQAHGDILAALAAVDEATQ